MSTTMHRGDTRLSAGVSTDIGVLDGAAAGYGISAAVTIVFNTLLAWIKDAYDPLNSFMASLSGHHWTTHSLVDIAVFLILGAILTNHGVRIDGARMAMLIAGAVIIGGGGLALWFVLT